jgi:hypothetical protein
MSPLNPIFYLLADDVAGPWGGVVAAWCDHAHATTLCLAADPEHATAYLVAAPCSRRVVLVLRELYGLDPARQTVWINDRTGQVRAAPTADELLTQLLNDGSGA